MEKSVHASELAERETYSLFLDHGAVELLVSPFGGQKVKRSPSSWTRELGSKQTGACDANNMHNNMHNNNSHICRSTKSQLSCTAPQLQSVRHLLSVPRYVFVWSNQTNTGKKETKKQRHKARKKQRNKERQPRIESETESVKTRIQCKHKRTRVPEVVRKTKHSCNALRDKVP